MAKVKIKITKHWNVPPHKDYSIGDEYMAQLYPCSDDQNYHYAVLENGYTIPNGNFDVLNEDKFIYDQRSDEYKLESKCLREIAHKSYEQSKLNGPVFVKTVEEFEKLGKKTS